MSTYCLSVDSSTCFSPETYVPFNAVPPQGQTILEIDLESARVIGEYVSDLKFYGSRVINVFIKLDIASQTMQLETKVLGRNL